VIGSLVHHKIGNILETVQGRDTVTTDHYYEVTYGSLNVIFTARHRRHYASMVYALTMCLSVRLSVRLSQAGIVPKRLNLGSRKQCHTIAQGL